MTGLAHAEQLEEPGSRRLAGLVGLGVLLVLLVVGLSWSKWLPYLAKARSLAAGHPWPGSSVFHAAGTGGPSLTRAWDFTTTYLGSIWQALLVALVVGAAVALLPRVWLSRTGRHGPWGQATLGAAASLPSMMCTCCTAPVAVSLRRSGLPLSPTVAYWLGNPMLNPAVLVFLLLVLPWQYAVARLAVGLVVVLVAAVVVTRVGGGEPGVPVEVAGPTLRELPARYARRLAMLALILVPEYVVVVFVVGLLSGWAANFSSFAAAGGALALVVFVVAGTLLVVPTGGEIPIVLALLAGGASAGLAGSLLITLPAISLPSIVMVGRTLSWRAVTTVAGVVAAGGLVGAAVLSGLS